MKLGTVVLRLLADGAACSPNVTFSNTSAPACQKSYIFQMNFNDFYLAVISLILHRCSRVMNPMVSCTCGFCVAQNIYDFQWNLHLWFFRHVRHFKILLSPLVLATFQGWHQNSRKVVDRQGWQNSHGFSFITYFQRFCNVFVLTSSDAISATLAIMQRTCRNKNRLRAPLSTKPQCA